MADYFPLLARAISALPENNGEARRVVYERARAALLAQLRGAVPPLPDEDVTRERLALEEAVRRVESEYAAMAAASTGGQRAGVMAPPQERAAAERAAAERAAGDRLAGEGAADPRASEPRNAEPPSTAPAEPGAGVRSGLTPRAEPRVRAGEAPAPAPRGGEDLRVERERPPAREAGRARTAPPPRPVEEEPASGGGWGRIILLAVVLLVVAGAAALGYTQRDAIIAMIRDLRAGSSAPVQEAAKPAAPEVAKSTDRIAQAAPAAPRKTAPQTTGSTQAMVAQRAVLFEENPGGQQGLQQFVGNVVWKTESYDPGNGLPPDIGVHATVEIPDRQFKVEFTFRRNQDASLPASHIIEIQFELPPNFDLGNVANVPGMRAKASETAQGVPLIGLAVRVTPGFFLVGLSAQDVDRQRNLGLLITRNWLDLPMVFSNGRRGILALEKGVQGDRVFREAYTAWGLPVPKEEEAPAPQQ